MGSRDRDIYRPDLLRLALGHEPRVPVVLAANRPAGEATSGAVLGAGAGDNAAAALGVGAEIGDVVVSIGTSGVVCAVSRSPTADPSGTVAGFASATGEFLPLVCTLNAARVLDAAAAMLQVDHSGLSRLALNAPPGAEGLVLVPYLEGERTPNRPDATGALHGLTLRTSTPTTWPERRSRACCAGWPTVLTLWNATAPASIASSWWVAARDPRRSGSSPRRYSATR